MTSTAAMLRLARHRVGLGAAEAALVLGTSLGELVQAETSGPPDEAYLRKAAAAFGCPRDFFDLRHKLLPTPASLHPLAGTVDLLAPRDVEMATAELNIRVMQLDRFLESIAVEPTITLPQFPPQRSSQAEKAAQAVRSAWGLPSGPVINLTALIERAGFVVGLTDFGGAPVSSLSARPPGLPPLILIHQRHGPGRRRQALAHELGHLLLHALPSIQMDKEADAFAMSLLLPAADIRLALGRRQLSLELLARLAGEWKVSLQAMLFRAEELGLVDLPSSRQLWHQMNAKGWALNAPSEMFLTPETPTIMASLIDAHFQSLGFSMAQLCRLVPMTEAYFGKLHGIANVEIAPRPKLRIVP